MSRSTEPESPAVVPAAQVYRRLGEITDQGIWVLDAQNVTRFVNQSMADLLGVTRESLIGQPITAYLAVEMREEVLADLDGRRHGTRGQSELRYVRPDGTDVWVRVHSDPMAFPDGTYRGVLMLHTDITDERRTLAEHATRGERAQAFFDHTLDGITVLDDEGRYLDVNPAACAMFGVEREQIIGRHLDEFVPADWRTMIRERWAVAPTEGSWREEYRILRPDGEERDVEVTRTANAVSGGHLAVMRDVTDRRRSARERERLEAQLSQARTLESVGQLAGGIAHDFNNLLGVVLTYTALAEGQAEGQEDLLADLGEIRAAAERAAALTQKLLVTSSRDILQPEMLDLHDVVRQWAPASAPGDGIELAIDQEDGLWPVLNTRRRVEQVLAELELNARAAVAPGGRIVIRTYNVVADAANASGHSTLEAGRRYVCISVKDDGCGIADTSAGRIFEPFFTTRPAGEASGLGLSTVHGIVTQCGGHVDVDSVEGVGTEIRVMIPAAVPEEAGEAEPSGVDPEELTILLVEDEPGLRRVATRILSAAGYNVLEADGGSAALRLAERHGDSIRVLVTDVVMPGMSGRQLGDELGRRLPGLATVYMSGYTDDVVMRHGITDTSVMFIEKPFTAETLRQSVTVALGQSAE